jgi:UDP:flavonoid glycosyltransferase YjiC (YdhE family)
VKRIVFVAPPFAGHLNPQIPLACAARDAGYAVSFITGERKVATLTAQGLTAQRLASVNGDALEAIANGSRRVGSNPAALLAQFRQNLQLLPAIREELLLLWSANRPSLVVADSVAPVAGLVCEELSIPWITTIATPFAIENHRGVPSYCGGWGPEGGVWPTLRNALGRRMIHSFKSGVGWWFRQEFRAIGLQRPYRADGSEAIYSPRAILGFGIEELEFERDWPAVFQMMGPVIDAPENCPELVFPSAEKRVLVTLGTHLLWAKETLVQLVSKLAAAFPKVHFVVSLGQPENAGAAPQHVNEQVTMYPFVPYARDLGKFDAILHHGGAGVSYATIWAGVPSLVVPHDYDQFDFAARLVHYGLGLRVKSLAGPEAAVALARVLDRKAWPALNRFQEFARRYRPAETFLQIVNQAIGPAAAD